MGAKNGNLDRLGIDWVCERIAGCGSLTDVAKEAQVTTTMLVMWLNANDSRSARAREVRSWTAWSWDEKAEQELFASTNGFELQRARELASHYRWRASKIAPRIYGDKLQVEQDTTLHITVRRDDLEMVIDEAKNISIDQYKPVLIGEGGVLRAGGDGVEGNPTSTATSSLLLDSSEPVVEEKPKKKRKSKGSWIHGGGVMLTEEEIEKDTK